MFQTLSKEKIYIRCLWLIQSFFALWTVIRACRLSSRSILTPILFAAFFFYFQTISQLKAQQKEQAFTRHTAVIALIVKGNKGATLRDRHKSKKAECA